MKAQIVGLKTLDLRGEIPAMGHVNLPLRAMKKRVFTDDQWSFLNQQTTEDLQLRIRQGDHLIALLYRPEMLNMNPALADMVSSNLRFQQDEIRRIIEWRKQNGKILQQHDN